MPSPRRPLALTESRVTWPLWSRGRGPIENWGPQQKVLGYTSRRKGRRAVGTGLTQPETLLTFLVDITGLILEQLAQSLDIVLFGS